MVIVKLTLMATVIVIVRVTVTMTMRLTITDKKTCTKNGLDMLVKLRDNHYIISQRTEAQNLLSPPGIRPDKYKIYSLA